MKEITEKGAFDATTKIIETPARVVTVASVANAAKAGAKAIDPAALIVSLPQAARMLGQSQTEVRRWERLGKMPPLVRLPTRGTGKARRLYWRTRDIVAMVEAMAGDAENEKNSPA